MTRNLRISVAAVIAAMLVAPGCKNDPPTLTEGLGSFHVTLIGVLDPVSGDILDSADFGPESRLPFAVGDARTFHITARALDIAGNLASDFNTNALVSVEPGLVVSVNGVACTIPDELGTTCPFLPFSSGEAEAAPGEASATVTVVLTTGSAAIWLQDANPNPISPLPEDSPDSRPEGTFLCGRDIGFDDLPDFYCPDGSLCVADGACGDPDASFAIGATNPLIWFQNPTISDIQFPLESDDSPFDGFAVEVDNERCPSATFPDGDCLLVTTVTSDGFYVSDISEPPGSYESLFVFNFSQPEDLSAGDVLKSFGGGVSEFVGFTEVTFPRFEVLEEGRIDLLDALAIPVFTDRPSNALMEPYEASVIRVDNVSTFTEVRDCDLNDDGQVNICFFFDPCTPGSNEDLEDDCAFNCENTIGCTLRSSLIGFGQYNVTLPNGDKYNVVSLPALPTFDPMESCIPDPNPTCGGSGVGAWCADPNTSMTCSNPTTFSFLQGTLRQVTPARPRWVIEPRTPDDMCFSGMSCN